MVIVNKKMSKTSKSPNKVRALRDALHMKQEKFSKAVGVARSLVAACESGARTPTATMYIKLGNVASSSGLYSEACWFWERGGVDPAQMLFTAGQTFRERGLEASAEQIAIAPELGPAPAEIDVEIAARILRVTTLAVLRLMARGEIKGRSQGPHFHHIDFASVVDYLAKEQKAGEKKAT